MDVYEEYDWNCPEDTAKNQKIVEKRRLFKFLLGPNKDLDEVRGSILGTKPLPTIHEAFAEVKREESWKKLMLGKQTAAATTESSALAARGQSSNERKDVDVTIARNMVIQRIQVGISMVNLQIGNRGQMDVTVERTMPPPIPPLSPNQTRLAKSS